jgi:hypothetical protein
MQFFVRLYILYHMIILYGKTVWCCCMVIFHSADACPSPSAPSPHSLLTHLPPPNHPLSPLRFPSFSLVCPTTSPPSFVPFFTPSTSPPPFLLPTYFSLLPSPLDQDQDQGGGGGRWVKRGCVRNVKIAFLYIMKHVKILSYKVTLLHFMYDIYIYI